MRRLLFQAALPSDHYTKVSLYCSYLLVDLRTVFVSRLDSCHDASISVDGEESASGLEIYLDYAAIS